MNDSAGVPTCYRHPGRETYIRCQRCDRPVCPDCRRDAAVGFQCVNCVKEGHASTRTGRAAYGGLRPDRPGVVSMVLIGINALVWLAITAGGGYASRLYQLFGLAPTGSCSSIDHPGATYPTLHSSATCGAIADGKWLPGVADGALWQVLTSAFTHVEVWHIAFNMYALWVLGPQLEVVLGRARFIALYLIAGLAGSVSVLWLADPLVTTVGASGAIFGLMGALLVVGHKVGADLRTVWIWVAINAVLSFTIPHVSWQGHLGGFIGGGVVAAVLAYAPRERRTLVQGVGLGGIVVVLVAAAFVRAGMLA